MGINREGRLERWGGKLSGVLDAHHGGQQAYWFSHASLTPMHEWFALCRAVMFVTFFDVVILLFFFILLFLFYFNLSLFHLLSASACTHS